MSNESVVYNTRLTRKEEAMMRVLWSAKRPLATSEIIEVAGGMGYKLNLSTTQSMVKSLLAKNLIKVSGITLMTTVYARKFEPALTSDDFTGLRVQEDLNKGALSKVSSLIAYLVKNEALSDQDIEELESVLHEYKDRD